MGENPILCVWNKLGSFAIHQLMCGSIQLGAWSRQVVIQAPGMFHNGMQSNYSSNYYISNYIGNLIYHH